MDRIQENCHFCGWRCGVNRNTGEKGFCRLTDLSNYASEFLHIGEEPEFIPSTIFLRAVLLPVSTARTGISQPFLK
jgi:putative pyruvate formate lyase activating enzyme